ncbi:hypothetical protein NQ318_022849 [Aromia moschata]|uniref:Uncharacterized protein n=1 Tax=Aromia moschata TaxID=1265417 RepID=A0AAV8XVX0_9CUCU|nr:hypothetical protein NQ318_022849 [Aromia moschata]
MHPYKLVPTNELAEDDFDRPILFCAQTMQVIDGNSLQIDNVLFSDESTFTLHGHVNRQDCRYWSRANPHWMRELKPDVQMVDDKMVEPNTNEHTVLVITLRFIVWRVGEMELDESDVLPQPDSRA